MIYGQQTIRVMQNVINSDVVIIHLSVFYVVPLIDDDPNHNDDDQRTLSILVLGLKEAQRKEATL